ncbi:MAG: hypothetical protein KBA66_18605 [Leptospiraceae bacterium]|nr:hypothetical protein [Leptospiraceae bacterium]
MLENLRKKTIVYNQNYNLLFILFLLVTFSIASEEIKLNNGKTLQNVKIEKETEDYIIITTEDDLAIKIENSKIEKIERSDPTQKEKKPKPPEIIFSQLVANDIIVFGQ